jgi:hypothetical protein
MSRGAVRKSCTAANRSDNQVCTVINEEVKMFEPLLKYPPSASAIMPPTMRKTIVV